MKRLYDVVLIKRKKDGSIIKNKEGKNIYDNWGSVIEDDKGYKKLILKSMTGDIWFDLYESDKKPTQTQPEQSQPSDSGDSLDNDVSF